MQVCNNWAPGLVAQRFLVFVIWVRALTCKSVTPAVFYLPAGLVGCSVDPGISCGARKLARTSRVKKKKKSIQQLDKRRRETPAFVFV